MSTVPKLETDHFVGGRRVPALSKETYTSLNPANNEPIATFAVANAADIDRAVREARKAFDEGPWPHMKDSERARILQAMAAIIRAKAETLGTIESMDVGKLLSECVHHDVARASENIAFFARAVRQWQDEAFYGAAQSLGSEVTTLSVTRRRPVGVAGLIVPWNSPLMLATWKIGPCLAAGNTCVIKPPTWAALSVLQLGEIAKEAGVPDGVLNILPGGVEAGEALVRHTGVNRISFTGSVPAGKAVQRANAEVRLAPVSLELGGKAPSIVFTDADLDLALKGVARGIFRSQGQSCVAGSRLLLEQGIYDKFLDRLAAAAAKMRIGDPLDPATEIGPLITREHLKRVEDYIESGLREGARLVTGGRRPADGSLARGNYLEPTIFDRANSEMRIVREEIFGPVLAAIPFRTTEEAIRLANDTRFGLSASIWTRDTNRALRVAEALETGMIWVNSHFLRDLRAPFGGVKESGVGSEGGRYSIEFYTQPKMICLPF